MIEGTSRAQAEQITTIEKSASTILEGVKSLLSAHSGSTENRVACIRELQRADMALSRASGLASEAGLDAESTRLAHKRKGIDRSVAAELTNIANRIGRERDRTVDTLNAIFKLGHAPDIVPDRWFRGQLLATTLFAPLDAYGRFVTRFYLPWKGKRFDACTSIGCNVFTPSAPIMGRLFWPFYGAWKHYRPGYYTGFNFNTYTGQGVEDPEVSTFKLDYDNPGNPRFLVRSVLDELVQVTGNYYLGKALLWRPAGHYKLAAFFALRK